MYRRLCRLIADKNRIFPIEVRDLPRRRRLALTFTTTLLRYLSRARGGNDE